MSRPVAAPTVVLLLLAALSGCAGDPPAPAPALGKEVEVNGYGTELRKGELVFAAEYTIRNPGPAPVEYRIGFTFDGPDFSDSKWVRRTVRAGGSAVGDVATPWPKHHASSEVTVAQVLENPL
ncbi:hypothetical protein [Streptomyces sp. NPDC058739]|uniref:hypothetical protein n=1 Tax=Streptomyces sp. NPDC058739 TaxID=3346618 RepID=UPI0036A8CC0C